MFRSSHGASKNFARAPTLFVTQARVSRTKWGRELRRALGKQLGSVRRFVGRPFDRARRPSVRFTISFLDCPSIAPSLPLPPSLPSTLSLCDPNNSSAHTDDHGMSVRPWASSLTFAIHFDYFIRDIHPNKGRLACNFRRCKINGRALFLRV